MKSPPQSPSPGQFRCPVGGARLRPATTGELSALNQELARRNPRVLGDGTSITGPLEAAWRVDAPDGGYYPVLDGIPLLLADALLEAPPDSSASG